MCNANPKRSVYYIVLEYLLKYIHPSHSLSAPLPLGGATVHTSAGTVHSTSITTVIMGLLKQPALSVRRCFGEHKWSMFTSSSD